MLNKVLYEKVYHSFWTEQASKYMMFFHTELLIWGMHCLQLSILIGCPKLILSLILLQNSKPMTEGDQIKTTSNNIFK